jgi:hypothetical protein
VSRSPPTSGAGAVRRIDFADEGHGQTSVAAADQVKTNPRFFCTEMPCWAPDLGGEPSEQGHIYVDADVGDRAEQLVRQPGWTTRPPYGREVVTREGEPVCRPLMSRWRSSAS